MGDEKRDQAATARLERERAKEAAQRIIADIATTLHGMMCYIGDRLGIFKAMAGAGPLTVVELAGKTGLSENYLREWLSAMVAGEYVGYDAGAATYVLSPEYGAVLADEGSLFFIASYFQMAQAMASMAPRVADAFRTGKGVAQSEYPPSIFEATERNSWTRYRHKLVGKWIAAMPDVVGRLERGAAVADVGCGGGRAAILIARAFPRTRVFGFDIHPGSVERARGNAAAAGLSERVTFEVRDGTNLPERRFDFITTLDVVHDAADPVALLDSIRRALTADGTHLMQEINVADALADNIKPMGKMVYSVSTLYCMNASLAQGGAGIGAAMGEAKARELAGRAGFSHFRRLPIKDGFAALYELRP
jgi:2-polyprenyl-3-methyl-5-hydroxy-6-metoxy-1,4-benzoquinol methylase